MGGCDGYMVEGFGFNISPEEFKRVSGSDLTLNELISDFNESLKNKGCRQLPDGFERAWYGDGESCVGCIISTSQDLSEILRGDIPCPDFTPILEWAKTHDIKFENDKPKLFIEMWF